MALLGHSGCIILAFVLFDNSLLAVDPQTYRFDNVVFLNHVYVLMFQQNFQFFFLQVLDVRIVD